MTFHYSPPQLRKIFRAFLFTLLAIVFSFNFAEAYIWELNHTSCNSLRVESPFVLPSPKIYVQAQILSCDGENFLALGSPPSIHRFTYKLCVKQHPNDAWVLIKSTATDAISQHYTGLQDGIYYVRIDVNGSDNVDIYSYFNPCGSPPLGKRFNSNISDWYITPEATIGDPQVGFILEDNNNNDRFCQPDIVAAGGIFLSTISSSGADLTTGETHYRIDICKDPFGSSCDKWTSTYWQEGPVPDVVNLLTDVWQLHHSTWTFWKDFYEVNLAISQDNCVSYDNYRKIFRVVEAGGNCRLRTIEEEIHLSVYPNPSIDEIFFEGIPPRSSPMPYQILDISGRAVSSGILPAFNASVNVHNLQPGMYVIGLEIDGKMNTLRFVVAQ